LRLNADIPLHHAGTGPAIPGDLFANAGTCLSCAPGPCRSPRSSTIRSDGEPPWLSGLRILDGFTFDRVNPPWSWMRDRPDARLLVGNPCGFSQWGEAVGKIG